MISKKKLAATYYRRLLIYDKSKRVEVRMECVSSKKDESDESFAFCVSTV